jgi:3-hydroxybutyryl-CoA dehydrogenase
MSMDIKKVVVVGSGTMGAGIGQLAAQQGFEVTVTDIEQSFVDKAEARIVKGLDKRIAKGKISEDDKQAVLSKLSFAVGNEAAKEADFVLESVVEDLEIKRKIFAELDELTRPEVVLATNTTSMSITAIAEATKRPEKVVQMHFFNPPTIMKLVEIMPGKKTAKGTLDTAEAFGKALGKDPVVCEAEAPAGIVSRVLGQLLNEATWLVQTGVARPADIDKAMKLGAGHPMGPLQLVDMIGLDVHRAKMQTLRSVLDDPRYQHPPVVDEMVEKGQLGKKSGKGFYDYD